MFDRLIKRGRKPKAAIPFADPSHIEPLRNIAAGAKASESVGDRRLFPALIVDISGRPDIDKLMEVHSEQSPGEVDSWWGVGDGKEDGAGLALSFKEPLATTVILFFPLEQYAGFVDQIVRTKGLYLIPGVDGDSVLSTMSRPQVLIEVQADFEEWDKLVVKALVAQAKRDGIRGRQARKRYAQEVIEGWRSGLPSQLPTGLSKEESPPGR